MLSCSTKIGFSLVGDVSGKGVPASLFMALSKTLCKSLARREHVPLDALLRLVNEEISQENSASQFMAAIVGIINVRTGEMQFCSAGHDSPILLREASHQVLSMAPAVRRFVLMKVSLTPLNDSNFNRGTC